MLKFSVYKVYEGEFWNLSHFLFIAGFQLSLSPTLSLIFTEDTLTTEIKCHASPDLGATV